MTEILGAVAGLLVIPLLIAFFVTAFKGARNYTCLTQKYKGCFGWFSAQMVIMLLLLGIVALVGGIVTAVSGDTGFGLLLSAIGIGCTALGVLLFLRIKKKVAEKGLEGKIIMPMLMLVLGRGLRMVIKVNEVAAPVAADMIADALEAEKAKKAEEQARAEAEKNVKYYNSYTGETYLPNSDGSMFKTADGEFVNKHQLEKNQDIKKY